MDLFSLNLSFEKLYANACSTTSVIVQVGNDVLGNNLPARSAV